MSIPTMFAGVQMRSRLEARWAAFFTALGWNWEYEPFDLSGWIPDFLLRGSWGSVLVEVKPTDRFLPEIAKEMHEATLRTVWSADIDGPGHHDMVLVGISPRPVVELSKWAGDGMALGWFLDADPVVIAHSWPGASEYDRRDEPKPAQKSSHRSRFDLLHPIQSFHHRLSGAYDGDAFNIPADTSEVTALWRKACNRTQWNAPVAVAR
jgi:hypothetical protein